MNVMRSSVWRLWLLLVMLVVLAPAPAGAQSQTWDWKSGLCGALPGGLLEAQTFNVAPNSEVSVVPPSYDIQFGPRIYVGIFINGQFFPETSSPEERRATVTGPSVTVSSSRLCSADPQRRPGVIRLSSPPPATTWDWSYSYSNPTTAAAQQYIVQTSNAVLYFENPVWLWKPIIGGTTFANTTPARITYRFPFPQPVREARLLLNMPAFHFSYSQGHNRLFGSRDGVNWVQLMDVPPPAFGFANSGSFNALLPSALLGGSEIWLRAELSSYGPLAPAGGVFTNTAQHSRYDIRDNLARFKLDVNFTPDCPVTWTINRQEINNATAIPHVMQGSECGDVTVSVSSTAYANGSAIDPTTMESVGLAEGTVFFTVERERALAFNVSIGGVMGGSGLFESTARIEGRITEDGVPVATFAGTTGSGIDEWITLRPIPHGYKNVIARETHPYIASPGRQYALEFFHRLSARASLSASNAFANFAGSTGLTIGVTPIDLLPRADAGPDQAVDPGTIVMLDGTGSSSPDSASLSYQWTQVGGDLVDLSDAASPSPSFEALAPGLLRFELVVDDGVHGSPPAYVNVVIVDNSPPEAVADEALVNDGETVHIDVLANDSDPNADPLEVVSVTVGTFGTVAVNADQTVRYTANVLGSLLARIEALPLDHGLINSLKAKLQAAQASFPRGNRQAGLNQLGALVNELEALVRSGKLDPDPAGEIIAIVQMIKDGGVTDTFTYTISDPGGLTDTAIVTLTVEF